MCRNVILPNTHIYNNYGVLFFTLVYPLKLRMHYSSFCFKEAVRRTVTDDRAPKLIARALSIQDRKSVQSALLIIKEGCLYPEFQLQKYIY